MIHDLQAYRRKLSRIRREKDIPNTDDDFVRCLMNTLDELVDENKRLNRVTNVVYEMLADERWHDAIRELEQSPVRDALSETPKGGE